MSRYSEDAVKPEEIHDLLDGFSKSSYKVKGDPRVRRNLESYQCHMIQFICVWTVPFGKPDSDGAPTSAYINNNLLFLVSYGKPLQLFPLMPKIQ